MLGTLTFKSSFTKDVLLKDVQHVNLFPRMGDVQVAFGILIHYFVHCPLYFLWCTPPSSTFTKFFISFDSSLPQVFGHHLDLGSLDSLKRPLACKQASLPITFGGIRFISTSNITFKSLFRELGPCCFNHSY